MRKSTDKEFFRNVVNVSYDDYLERLKIEFSEFIRYAEAGKTIRYQGLRSRKKSMKLRQLLKYFRPVSISQEKKINEVYQSAKENVKHL